MEKAVIALSLSLVALAIPTAGQSVASSFERCFAYVSAIDELNTKLETHQAAGRQLTEVHQQTLTRLAQAKQRVDQFLQVKQVGSVVVQQNQAVLQTLQAELNAAVNNPQEGSLSQRNQLGSASASLLVAIDAAVHQLKTNNTAGQLAYERYVTLLADLSNNVREMLIWEEKSVALFNQYWEIADVAAVKSELEIRSSLRELNLAPEQDAGAALARAIAHLRLDQYDKALPLLDQLVELPGVALLAYGARAELFYRTGRKREAIADLKRTAPAGLQDPRVRMHRAQALVAAGQLKDAEVEWEAVLKLGGHEVAARRAIALINSSLPTRNERTKKKALENAQLAAGLAEDEWSCQLAVALAAIDDGDQAKAVEFAHKAALLAVGENQGYCDEITERIRLGDKDVAWKF